MANTITILPARYEDVPRLATISEDAFKSDVQTEMKSHGTAPFNMREHSLQSVPEHLKNPRTRVIKAVEPGTGGAIMGFCIWHFREIDPPAFPDAGPVFVPPVEDEEGKEKRGPDDPIDRLEKLTGGDFSDWMAEVMPKGAVCLFVGGLSVAPEFQRRGVASALLRWGIDIVDAHADRGAFAWVHSSAGAWPAYERAGFKTDRTLDVDLDEYAPVPAPADRYEGGKWGHYVFRYMIYGTTPGDDDRKSLT